MAGVILTSCGKKFHRFITYWESITFSSLPNEGLSQKILIVMAVPNIWDPTDDPPSENLFNQSNLFCEKSHVKLFAKTFLTTFFWLVFFVGTVGNALVILVYWRYRGKKNLTDRYLIHLTIADLLFLFTLPFWATAAWDGWNFKTVMCKIVNSMYKINFYSCMLFLMCISFDRYIVVVQPRGAHHLRRNRLMHHKLICFVAWLVAIALCIPEIMYSRTVHASNTTACQMMYPPHVNRAIKVADLSLKIVIGFLLPLLVMVVCYIRVARTLFQARRTPKHKSLRMITLIILAFLLSQFPYNSILLVKTTFLYFPTTKNCETSDSIEIGFQLAQSIAFLHSCLNPFLYFFAGERFRQAFFQMLKCTAHCQVNSPEQCNSVYDCQEEESGWSSALFGRSKMRQSFSLSSP
ncbi:C-C chemokine receptor type 9 [Tiliqua scincoides]|uniref:C-C chemokine receptor type 9 n=1 Tax=Tiliqua scincoides TaxID=71010 RepID=UPI003462337C